ncbi:NAD(P)/FAD-dependent oxidoreductase [Phyllobacterium ifriqiyense]|uniref:NAD(P)/FAD-dependent oxidoreductase n=1 Tax=Phyllobacterium ifriqiyense TaxID=314238 RepID=UPI003392BB2E
MTTTAEATKTHDVVIVGAGIAGLALTRELHRRGISVVALEQRQQLIDAGLAINLPGNAVAALRELGLGEELKQFGFPINRREYRSSRGRLLFKIDEAAFWGKDHTPRCMRRSDLATMLAKDIPEDTIWHRRTVTSAVASDESIRVTTAAGERLSGKYLVGADGVHSTVRKLCFPDDGKSVAELGHSSWRFIATNPGIDCWSVWMGEKAIVLLIPVTPQEVYCWATVTSDVSSAEGPAALLRHTEGFPVEPRRVLEEALSEPKSILVSPLNEIRLLQWSHKRAFLIGDAAHATAPVWAQGAALALEDSLVLAQLISEIDDPHRISDEFHRLRQQRVRHVRMMTDRASKIARLPGYLRNIMMPLLGPLSYKRTYAPLKSRRP